MYLFWWHLKSEWVRGWFNSAPAYEACVHRDALEVLGGGKRRGRSATGQRQTWLWRLCYSICLLSGPELFVLLASKTLVIVSFALEQLFEVGFAVKFTLKRCKTAKAARNGGIKELHADHSGQEKKNKKKTSILYIITWVWHCSACSRNMLNGRQGCLQPVSPLGRLSSNMMYTLPSGCWSWRTEHTNILLYYQACT